jgi:RimJ/RimL family protein N-acetyltransferase
LKGHLVSLSAMEEEDYYLMSKWLQPSLTSALGRGTQDFVSAENIKKDVLTGSTSYVTVKTNDEEKIGFISWKPLQYVGNYEIGGIIGHPELWDSGCGAEATVLVMDHLFHAKNAHRVQFITGLYNKRTVGMLIKNQVTVEGILRDYYFLDGQYHDGVVWSILRDEYYAIDDYGQPQDMIPAAEKEEAREEFTNYVKEHWNDRIFHKLIR